MLMFKPTTAEKKDKYYILDYSFYIYNGSFAHKYPCKNSTKNKVTLKPECNCDLCEGTGWEYMSAKGVRTGGIYHALNHLIPKMIDGYKCILVFDPPKANLVRTKLLDNYKGNRPPTPEWIEYQMNWGERVFPYTKNLQCYMADESESDDVMAVIALEKANEGCEVIVASDDKDMFPLLGHDNVTLYRQKAMFGKDEFGPYMKKKYNIDFTDPGRFSEFLAIIGDAADNYNIIKGLGPKAAEHFLSTYDNIMDLFQDWDNVPEKYKKKLVKSCTGDTCAKCKSTKDKPCDNRVQDSTKTIRLESELNMSLQLAYLDLEAKYNPITQPDNEVLVRKEFERLQLKTAINNFDLFFR